MTHDAATIGEIDTCRSSALNTKVYAVANKASLHSCYL